MRDSRTIWYRGEQYLLGRSATGYAMWTVHARPSRPAEEWPATPQGWSAAWSRFTALERPGAVVHLAAPGAPRAGRPFGAAAGNAAGNAAGAARGRAALACLAAGLALGVASLFPAYLSGSSLASHAYLLVPHVAYLAAWAASALLIAAGGPRRAAGVLAGLGVSIVTFGFFLSDIGSAVSGGSQALGPGLILGVLGWLGCTAGCAAAFRPRPGDLPRTLRGLDARTAGLAAVTGLAALGAAIAFAPSWDRYTLRTAAGVAQSVTAGNSFANPAPVMAGDVAVMVALVVVAVAAAAWRPARLGAALLAGAIIPMAATAVSAVIQIGEPLRSTAFGIPPAQATQAGLTISAGLTAAFWVYCAFLLALALAGAGLLLAPGRPRRPGWYAAGPGGSPGPWRAGTPGAGPWAPPGAGWPAGPGPGGPAPVPGPPVPGAPAPGGPVPGAPAPGGPAQPGAPAEHAPAG
jgi:hypothetical protein